MKIAQALDDFGVEYIELTSPAASPESRADCEAICKMGLKRSKCVRSSAFLRLARGPGLGRQLALCRRPFLELKPRREGLTGAVDAPSLAGSSPTSVATWTTPASPLRLVRLAPPVVSLLAGRRCRSSPRCPSSSRCRRCRRRHRHVVVPARVLARQGHGLHREDGPRGCVPRFPSGCSCSCPVDVWR